MGHNIRESQITRSPDNDITQTVLYQIRRHVENTKSQTK